MKTSDKKETFESGAERDTAEGKVRPDLISPFAEERLAEWLRLGAKHYGDRNWEAGMPNTRYWASLKRHVMQFGQGDESEDHLSAILFGAMAIIHNQEMIERGVLPNSLDDMPDYSGPVPISRWARNAAWAGAAPCDCPGRPTERRTARIRRPARAPEHPE